MFGIMASVLRNATRTEPRPTPTHSERMMQRRHEEERRRERDALEREIRFRRGFW